MRLGSRTLMTNVRLALSSDCPRRLAKSMHDQCGALLVRVRSETGHRASDRRSRDKPGVPSCDTAAREHNTYVKGCKGWSDHAISVAAPVTRSTRAPCPEPLRNIC